MSGNTSSPNYNIDSFVQFIEEVIGARYADIGRAETDGMARAIANQSVRMANHAKGCASQYSREIEICRGWIANLKEMKEAGWEISVPKSSTGRELDTFIKTMVQEWQDYKKSDPARTKETDYRVTGSSGNGAPANNQ